MSKHIKIWSFADVDRSGKVRWTAEELGYHIEEIRIKPGEQAADPYRQLNPYEQIPVAELDGKTLMESTAICILLAERNPEAALDSDAAKEFEDLFEDVSSCSENKLWKFVDTKLASLMVLPDNPLPGVFAQTG